MVTDDDSTGLLRIRVFDLETGEELFTWQPKDKPVGLGGLRLTLMGEDTLFVFAADTLYRIRYQQIDCRPADAGRQFFFCRRHKNHCFLRTDVL